MEEDWILLKIFHDPNAAQLVCGMLEENGIRAIAINKKDSSYGLFGQIELYCHIEQAHEALNLIELNEEEE